MPAGELPLNARDICIAHNYAWNLG